MRMTMRIAMTTRMGNTRKIERNSRSIAKPVLIQILNSTHSNIYTKDAEPKMDAYYRARPAIKSSVFVERLKKKKLFTGEL